MRARERQKHPNPRDVLLCWSSNFPHPGLPRNTRRCRACTTGRPVIRKLPLHIIISSVSLTVLKITWGSCESFGVNSTDPNLQCGYLDVPLDYHDSSAGNARLAVAKYMATVPNKLGTLFFNPGNPSNKPIVHHLSANPRFIQADLVVQESMSLWVLARSLAKFLRVTMNSSPGILVESGIQCGSMSQIFSVPLADRNRLQPRGGLLFQYPRGECSILGEYGDHVHQRDHLREV